MDAIQLLEGIGRLLERSNTPWVIITEGDPPTSINVHVGRTEVARIRSKIEQSFPNLVIPVGVHDEQAAMSLGLGW